MHLKFLQKSFLKASTEQSSKLTINQLVVANQGELVPILNWTFADDGHLRVQTAKPINNLVTWFVFEPHIQVCDSKGVLVDTDPDPETAPRVDAHDQPDVEPKPVVGRPQRIITLPKVGRIDLYDPISPEAPNFYWYEALHDGERIPKTMEQVEAIQRMARGLQKVRRQFGKPLTITSWFRPEPFNSRAGGARRSQHLGGGAADIKIEGMTGRQIAAQLGWWEGGMGIYKNLPGIVHLDVRGTKARWGL